jgi:predicted restriction endonuclease
MTIQKDTYIYKKEIDWSVLHYGLNIPVSIQLLFYHSIKEFLRKGDNKNITLIFDGEEFKAKLTNIYFDEKKYPNHKELLQIRYSKNSAIAKKLREIFYKSNSYLQVEKAKLINSRTPIKVPDKIKEFLVLYTTDFKDTFLLDSITKNDLVAANSYISTITEEEFEMDINYNRKDFTAKIEEKTKIIKIRKLDKSISDNLKLLYQNKCQICGLNFGINYNGNISEAHHIQPFTKSLNNNSDNIMIICPNHHRLIHKVKPIFDKSSLMFLYQNGYKEKLVLNYHL